MDDPNITMEEYIGLEVRKALVGVGSEYRETATYGKIWDNVDVFDLESVKTEFSAIVFNDTILTTKLHLTSLGADTSYLLDGYGVLNVRLVGDCLQDLGRFLEKLAHGAFSGTNGEDAVEQNEKFLNSVEPINIQNVSSNRLRLSVFPVSLTGAAMEKANVVEMLWDLNNNEFKKWIDEEVNNNREPWNDQIEVSENESEVAEIFRIETDVFDYESRMCKAFDEFNYFLKIDPDVPNKYIPRFKTYEQYKDDWIYEWNDKIPCDYEWYKALVDCELKDEALRNKAELDKSMNHDGESNDDAWSNYSPIEECSDQGK
ncbi:hypothetical protein Tco_0767334, partial [Tanacetum coccineum]